MKNLNNINKLTIKWFQELGLVFEDLNSEDEARNVFKKLLTQYFDEKVSVDIVSAVATNIYYEYFRMNHITIVDTLFENVLHLASEFKWSVSVGDKQKTELVLRSYLK